MKYWLNPITKDYYVGNQGYPGDIEVTERPNDYSVWVDDHWTIDRILMKDQARKLRQYHESKGTMLGDSHIRTDVGSQYRVAGLVASVLAFTDMESFKFEAQPGVWVELDRTTALAVGRVVSEHVQGCFTRCHALHATIDATSDEDLVNISLDTEWPGQ